MTHTYTRGPLGYAVLRDGKPIGAILRRGACWQVSITGFRPGNGDGQTHTFLTLSAAKAAVEKRP